MPVTMSREDVSCLARLIQSKLNVDVKVIVLKRQFFPCCSYFPFLLNWSQVMAPLSGDLVRERGKTSIQPCRQHVKGDDGPWSVVARSDERRKAFGFVTNSSAVRASG